jgi:hypothetical protein
MSIEQSKNDELIANQLRLAIQAHGETAVNSAAAKVEPPHQIKIDSLRIPRWADQISFGKTMQWPYSFR